MSQSRLEKIQALLAEQPHDPELHYMLAMEYVSQGDDETAVRTFEKLFAVAPTYAPAYHMAGRALQRLGRADQARALLSTGIPIALANKDEHAAGEMRELMEGLE